MHGHNVTDTVTLLFIREKDYFLQNKPILISIHIESYIVLSLLHGPSIFVEYSSDIVSAVNSNQPWHLYTHCMNCHYIGISDLNKCNRIEVSISSKSGHYKEAWGRILKYHNGHAQSVKPYRLYDRVA